MKKVILSLSITLFGLSTIQAQTNQGTFFVGGGLGFNSSNSEQKSGVNTVEGPIVTTFSISPGAGYFIANKLALGLDFQFISETENDKDNDEKTKASFLGASPYLRYYAMVSEQFGFTGSLGVSFLRGSSEIESAGITLDGPKSTFLSVGITPGIVFFPTRKVGIEANFGFLGYRSLNVKEKVSLGLDVDGNEIIVDLEAKETDFGLNFNSLGLEEGLGLQFSFRYYFAQ